MKGECKAVMGIENSAKVYIGYELYEDWGKIVPEEFYEENEKYFRTIDRYCDDGPVLFAAELDHCNEGQYTELSLNIDTTEFNIVEEFAAKFPEAITHKLAKTYLAAVVD